MFLGHPSPPRVRHTQHSGRRPKVSPWIQASTKMSGGAVDAWQVSAVASLVEELDKKILVVLRDGSKIIGFLRSFDQFANIVLENACERIIVGTSFSDIPLGLYIVRGENVVLMGDIDETIEWVDSLEPGPELLIINGGEHFFHGRLGDLRDAVMAFVAEHQ